MSQCEEYRIMEEMSRRWKEYGQGGSPGGKIDTGRAGGRSMPASMGGSAAGWLAEAMSSEKLQVGRWPS